SDLMKESIKSVLWKFNMNRALYEYVDKFYVNSLKESDRIRSHNYKVLKEAVAEEKVVLQHWNEVNFIDFSVNIDQDEQITEGKEIQAKCQVWLGEIPAQFLKVEVFYLYDEEKTFETIPMELEQTTGNGSFYKCSFKLLGYGPQDINARVRPANKIVENLHPELIKWVN
ncbi:MAG: hypothetical protein PHW62_05805, partial [Candidatus Ratteibacteria bacterium]|nr:hypothetical protein [Candidatus Ratteibacteria bacterium]